MAQPATLSPVDLQHLSVDELKRLAAQIQKRIQKLEQRNEAIRKLEEAAGQLGLSKADLVQHYGAPRKLPAPKYLNPANPAETWTGRGRKPAWVEEHLSGGGTLDQLKIKAAAAPLARRVEQ